MTDATWTIPDAVLTGLADRAPRYDEENAYCVEDLEALRSAGYLRLGVPSALGGFDAGLVETSRVQRRIAAAAPPTALALGMHQIWVQAARIAAARGEGFLELVMRAAAEDRLLAFGISEPGNDAVLFDSVTAAEPVDGGFRFTGTKIFTSNAPAWDVLSVFGKDASGQEPRLVHGFAVRGDAGVRTLDDWDTLGMRATQSRTTVLDGLFVPEDRIVRALPVGAADDLLVFAIFAAFEMLISSVYVGVAERAIAVAAEHVWQKIGADGRRKSDDGAVRHRLAAMQSEVDQAVLQIERLAAEADDGGGLGGRWMPLLVGTKARVAVAAQRVVDCAVAVVGGASYRRSHELSRLARDVRAAGFHPSSAASAEAAIADALLGRPTPA